MRRRSLIASLLVVAALAYLSRFVDRGWVPHDEGLIGQSADFVLRGGTPHVDYQEAYTGGLSQLYAALFRIVGVDLLHVRWLLFAGAAWAVFVVHAICRRHLPPIGAALGTWVALTWSFPNYFAGLPSWWLLICALTCVWALIRHDETSQWRYVLVSGLSAGIAVTVKQTGVYLVLALALSIAYGSRAIHPRAMRWVSRGLSALTVVFAIALLGDACSAPRASFWEARSPPARSRCGAGDRWPTRRLQADGTTAVPASRSCARESRSPCSWRCTSARITSSRG